LTKLSRADSLIDEVAVKPYPVSGIAQVPTRLACELHDRLQGVLPDALLVRMSAAEAHYPGSGNRGPFHSRSDALMSIAFCVACGVTHGRITLASTEAPNQLVLKDVLGRIRLDVDDSLRDTQITLSAELDGQLLELTSDGGELFHPSWQSISSDPEALASRCEAPAELVQDVSSELAGAAPDCSAIASELAAWRGASDRGL
jgi:hypothetical protein